MSKLDPEEQQLEQEAEERILLVMIKEKLKILKLAWLISLYLNGIRLLS